MPDETTLFFNEFLTKATYEISNGVLNGVSILDMPGFGSMVNIDGEVKWPNQLNMEIYKQLMNKNNNTWSKDLWKAVQGDLKVLGRLTKLEMIVAGSIFDLNPLRNLK